MPFHVSEITGGRTVYLSGTSWTTVQDRAQPFDTEQDAKRAIKTIFAGSPRRGRNARIVPAPVAQIVQRAQEPDAPAPQPSQSAVTINHVPGTGEQPW